MRKLILMAAAAAVLVPGAAVAQRHDTHNRSEARHDNRDRHDSRSNRDRRGHHNRSAYVAPYRNWNYRPVAVGYRLQPSFYGSRYYINDYGSYNVRAPGRYQRWIRYGNDLLLVNVRTGRVLRVVHYRYW